MNWIIARLREPSSHTSFAVFLAILGIYFNSLNIDPSPLGRALLLAGVIFAFIGFVLREAKG